ncbi:MAG TPA: Ig-like domain-containing protein [Candidatus Sulfotelmatobacter sp.]|nr:Ig-like domain-containing protein [Candidatus Sulfotelmatobacter sp.]
MGHPVTARAKSVQSIVLAPQGSAVALGKTQQFSATAVFSDGSKEDVSGATTWTSAQPQIASVSTAGLASSKAVGTTVIKGVYQAVSSSASLTINAAVLVSIAVAPQSPSLTPNHSVQLSATGTFTDGSTQDLSASVSWSTVPAGIISVSNTGIATAQSLGAATITATSNSVSTSDTITVVAPVLQTISLSPSAATIPLGEKQQLSAIGNYNDGSTRDLTNLAKWKSSDPSILGLNQSGMGTTCAQGSVTVTATSGSVKGETQMLVGPPVVVSISIVPANSEMALGGQQQLSALAKFSDGTSMDMTTRGTWSSSDKSIAGVSDHGLVLARKMGHTAISVSSDSVNGSADLTVEPALAVSYFSNAHTAGFADATIRLTNPGLSGGDLCADVYVFDQDQQLSECCACQMSPDGLLTLSVNSDLTGNPLTGVKSTAGVIKIVSAELSSGATCDPTVVKPDANLIAWSSNVQAPASSRFAITENPFQLAPLGNDELAALQNQCASASALGSGQGICTCGATSAPQRRNADKRFGSADSTLASLLRSYR